MDLASMAGFGGTKRSSRSTKINLRKTSIKYLDWQDHFRQSLRMFVVDEKKNGKSGEEVYQKKEEDKAAAAEDEKSS